jgi:putative oxidoreductase
LDIYVNGLQNRQKQAAKQPLPTLLNNARSLMSIFEESHSPWPSRMLSAIRIVAGLIFISFGTMKLFNYPPLPQGMPPISLMSQAGIAGVLEVVGGTLIVIGLLTRPVAFILAGEMAVAYFQFHAPQSFWPSVNMGVGAIMYCFLFLYLMVAGGGVWSIDTLIARRQLLATNRSVRRAS